MSAGEPQPRGARLIELLLRLYPRDVRDRFGAGMHYALIREWHAARRRGQLAVASFCTLTLFDVLWGSGLARLRRLRQRPERSSPGLLGGLRGDLRDARRSFSRSPLVTTLVVLSLALGIGANTAVFSILNGLYLRSLPVPDPDQLAVVGTGDRHMSFSHSAWLAIRDLRLVEAFAWYPARFDLSARGETDLVDGAWVSAETLDVLRLRPALGRGFAPENKLVGSRDAAVVVISHRLWQHRFAGQPAVIGQTLLIQRQPFTVVGVLPQGFLGPDAGGACDLMLPLAAEPLVRGADSWLELRNTTWLRIMVRVGSPDTFETVTAKIQAAQATIREASIPPSRSPSYLAAPLVLIPAASGAASSVGRNYWLPLQMLTAIVGLVLLVTCANVAALQLVRASARRHDLVIRRALGASRWRLARQCLVESAVLAAAGAFTGLLVAQATSRLLVAQMGAGDTVFLDLDPDARVLAFTTLVALATALVFGILPAVRSAGADTGEALAVSSRGIAGFRRGLAGDLIVIFQVAFSLVLVVAAGVFGRTFMSLANVELGFERSGVLLAQVRVPDSVPAAARPGFYLRLQQRVSGAPGVAAAGVSLISPMSGSTWGVSVRPFARVGPPEPDVNVYAHYVTPGWFAAYGLPLVQGRDFSEVDRAGSTPVAIVNRTLSRRMQLTDSPIGQSLVQSEERPPAPSLLLVGVCADAAYLSPREPSPPTIFLPLLQMAAPPPVVTIAVRSSGPAAATLSKTVAAAVASVEPTLPVTFRTLDDQVNASMVRERLLASVSAFFGGLALLLAGLGLYGLMAHGVALRRPEIALRMALGAQAPSITALVLSRAGLLLPCGIMIGAALAQWAARFAESLVFGLDAGDGATLAASIVVLVLVGLLAAWAPARKAVRTDPASTFRRG